MTKLLFDRSPEAACKNMKIYYRTTAVVSIAAAIIRSLAYFVSFDSDIGYFNSGFLPSLSNCFIVVACIFALSGFFFINKEAPLPRTLNSSPNAVFFASVFAGFIMVADFAYKVYSMIGEDKFEYYAFIFKKGFRAENAYLMRVTAIIEIFGTLSALLAAVWFFLRSSKQQRPRLVAALGFFPICRALAGIATVYFDMTVQMNHPSKLILEFALIVIMLYFLCEERFFVSEKHPRPVRYFVSGCATVTLGVAGGASEMLGFFSGSLSKGAFCIEAFFCLTMGIYALARVASFIKDAEQPTEPVSDETAEEIADQK